MDRKTKTSCKPKARSSMGGLTPQWWTAMILSFVAAATFIAGLVIPPPGEIHPSVIQGIGLMIVLVAIFFAWDAVVRGLGAKFEHGNTKVTISGKRTRKPDPPSSGDDKSSVNNTAA